MFSKELSELLFQVIKSWQVIAVTVVLVLYMSLVGYVLRSHHKPASVSKTKPKKQKKPKDAKSDAKKSTEPEVTEQD
jgi:Na+-transporting methylmalonyl-CoA/oxaloacetate decarboxylase gamma subunit